VKVRKKRQTHRQYSGPYVLGPNILSFPARRKARVFVHCFATRCIPPNFASSRISTPNPAAAACMTARRQTAWTPNIFLEQVKAAHNRPVTLCGYCQGGFTVAVNYLSGELDGLVDALITSCRPPMEWHPEQEPVGILAQIPKRFEDISFGLKTLPNGNQVVNGKLMSWSTSLEVWRKTTRSSPSSGI